jgi:hypothetical protein
MGIFTVVKFALMVTGATTVAKRAIKGMDKALKEKYDVWPHLRDKNYPTSRPGNLSVCNACTEDAKCDNAKLYTCGCQSCVLPDLKAAQWLCQLCKCPGCVCNSCGNVNEEFEDDYNYEEDFSELDEEFNTEEPFDTDEEQESESNRHWGPPLESELYPDPGWYSPHPIYGDPTYGDPLYGYRPSVFPPYWMGHPYDDIDLAGAYNMHKQSSFKQEAGEEKKHFGHDLGYVPDRFGRKITSKEEFLADFTPPDKERKESFDRYKFKCYSKWIVGLIQRAHMQRELKTDVKTEMKLSRDRDVNTLKITNNWIEDMFERGKKFDSTVRETSYYLKEKESLLFWVNSLIDRASEINKDLTAERMMIDQSQQIKTERFLIWLIDGVEKAEERKGFNKLDKQFDGFVPENTCQACRGRARQQHGRRGKRYPKR